MRYVYGTGKQTSQNMNISYKEAKAGGKAVEAPRLTRAAKEVTRAINLELCNTSGPSVAR